MSLCKNQSTHRGFTLIELLVVIAIIAFLAAILFPVFAAAKDSAKGSQCLSNLKQVSMAFFLYAGDNDDMLPRRDGCLRGKLGQPNPNAVGCDGNDGPGPAWTNWGQRLNSYKWQVWIWDYVRTIEVFRCPSRTPNSDLWNYGGELNNAYALNIALSGATNDWPDPEVADAYRNSFLGGSMTALQEPAAAFLVMELWDPRVWTYALQQGPNTQTLYPFALRESWSCALKTYGKVNHNAAPHRDGMTLTFNDGHAKRVSVDWFLTNSPSVNDYLVDNVPAPPRPDCTAGYPGGGTSIHILKAPPTWTQPWPLWALY
jgi:prepilin-type N-terminal cleavage/methylation domain-containing protein